MSSAWLPCIEGRRVILLTMRRGRMRKQTPNRAHNHGYHHLLRTWYRLETPGGSCRSSEVEIPDLALIAV